MLNWYDMIKEEGRCVDVSGEFKVSSFKKKTFTVN
jgi:hypothetical protein